jgi:hypothetical protein
MRSGYAILEAVEENADNINGNQTSVGIPARTISV